MHDRLLDKPSAITLRVRDIQNISRTLLKAADQAYKTGRGEDGRVLKRLGRTIRDNAAAPDKGGFREYGDFLKKYGNDSENETALELGRSSLTRSRESSPEAIKRELADMHPDASEHYKKGLAEAIYDLVDNAPTENPTKALDILDSPATKKKLRIAFDNERAADAFVSNMKERINERKMLSGLFGNTITAPTLAMQKRLLGGRVSAKEAAKHAEEIVRHPISKATGAISEQILNRLPPLTQGVLDDPEASAIFARAISNPDEFERLMTTPNPPSPLKMKAIAPPEINGPEAREAVLRSLGVRVLPEVKQTADDTSPQ